jgi:holo-[acyl-carrier protein] synthase
VARVIVGVGVDIVDIARFRAAIERTPSLVDRLFTAAEQRSGGRGRPEWSLAGRFAAKEALAKALGAPAGLRWVDAEIRTGSGGRPVLHVEGTVAAAAGARGVSRWHVSISHDGGMAVAVVIAEAGEGSRQS